jgi:hypothetical protein
MPDARLDECRARSCLQDQSLVPLVTTFKRYAPAGLPLPGSRLIEISPAYPSEMSGVGGEAPIETSFCCTRQNQQMLFGRPLRRGSI